MSPNEFSIVDVKDGSWTEVLELAYREQRKHFCVFPAYCSDSSIRFDIGKLNLVPSVPIFRGTFPKELIDNLPEVLLTLLVPGATIGDPGAQEIFRETIQDS